MKWFKHMSDMLEDTWVQDVFMAQNGIAGYGFICGIYEIYACECKENPGDWITIPMSTITRKLRLSSSKVERWLNDCSTTGKLSFEIVLREIRIKIPKMAELKDEWVSRKNKKLGSCSGVTPSKNKEERNKNNPPTPKGASGAFENFWKAYPKKVGKEAVIKTWKRKQLDPKFDEIMAGLMALKQSKQWTRDEGKYIPNPLTFINQGRWQDSIKVEISQPKQGNSRIARLLAARAIFNRFEPSVVIPREELETRPNMPDSIFHKGLRIVDSEYEPVA